MHPRNSSRQDNGEGDYLRWLGVGTEFCGVLAVSCYVGYKLDEAVHTTPWLLVSGFFVGFIGMLYMIIRRARYMQRK